MTAAFERSVFGNCPFDADYDPILQSIDSTNNERNLFGAMLTAQAILVRVAASVAIFALTVTPSGASACTFVAVEEIIKPNHMKEKCRQALSAPNRFLGKVNKGKLNRREFIDFVKAFDDGKYGCQENNEFTFRILRSYYSLGDRKLTDPAFLQRYAFNFPENFDPAEQSHVNGLIWLFTDYRPGLPNGWTPDQARTFVEMPKHWPIALARFGKSRERDDAVFASVTDPQSSHFDRSLGLRLADLPHSSRMQRRIRVASLFVDPRFGPTDFVKAEELLPISALYSTENLDQMRQQARAIWVRIVDAYVQSGTPALRDKGRRLRVMMLPPAPDRWPSIEPPRDGRIWLSLNDWPRTIPNPFAAAKFTSNLLTAADYPSRALREELTGSVTLGVRFGPDGKFSALEAIQSSGIVWLDEAAVSIILRRFRPKLADMIVEGHHGHEVWVPLLVVNWEIDAGFDDESNHGISHYSNGILTVIFTPRARIDEFPDMCGMPTSVFL